LGYEIDDNYIRVSDPHHFKVFSVSADKDKDNIIIEGCGYHNLNKNEWKDKNLLERVIARRFQTFMDDKESELMQSGGIFLYPGYYYEDENKI